MIPLSHLITISPYLPAQCQPGQLSYLESKPASEGQFPLIQFTSWRLKLCFFKVALIVLFQSFFQNKTLQHLQQYLFCTWRPPAFQLPALFNQPICNCIVEDPVLQSKEQNRQDIQLLHSSEYNRKSFNTIQSSGICGDSFEKA